MRNGIVSWEICLAGMETLGRNALCGLRPHLMLLATMSVRWPSFALMGYAVSVSRCTLYIHIFYPANLQLTDKYHHYQRTQPGPVRISGVPTSYAIEIWLSLGIVAHILS